MVNELLKRATVADGWLGPKLRAMVQPPTNHLELLGPDEATTHGDAPLINQIQPVDFQRFLVPRDGGVQGFVTQKCGS